DAWLSACGLAHCRGVEDAFVNRQQLVGARLRLRREEIAEVRGGGIEQVQRRNSKEPKNRFQQAWEAGIPVRNVSVPNPRTSGEQDRAVRIDMIDAALRIIFGNKDNGVAPFGQTRQKLQNSAERVIII